VTTTALRSDVAPELPPVADFVPGYEASAFFGIGAPKKTPSEIIEKLNKAINATLADRGAMDSANHANTGSPSHEQRGCAFRARRCSARIECGPMAAIQETGSSRLRVVPAADGRMSRWPNDFRPILMLEIPRPMHSLEKPVPLSRHLDVDVLRLLHPIRSLRVCWSRVHASTILVNASCRMRRMCRCIARRSQGSRSDVMDVVHRGTETIEP